jgi:hypothetical protein
MNVFTSKFQMAMMESNALIPPLPLLQKLKKTIMVQKTIM